MNTKAGFVAAYRARLIERYDWAKDEAKLDCFIKNVVTTLETPSMAWNKDGEAVTAAWHDIGNKGKPTYKQLRQLPG